MRMLEYLAELRNISGVHTEYRVRVYIHVVGVAADSFNSSAKKETKLGHKCDKRREMKGER